jgi:hypothetical protein
MKAAMKRHSARLLCLSLILAAGWMRPQAGAFCIGSDKSPPNYDPDYYSIPHEFRHAKYVVEARVIEETWLGEDGKEKPLQPPFQNGGPRPWGFDSYMGAYYDIEVLRAFKGDPAQHLRLFSENSTARFSLDVGSEYLFFITEGEFDQPVDLMLTIDNCGNSSSLKKGQAALHAIERLSHAK